MLSRAGIAETDWDIVIVGDGSGTGWADGCGWACALVDKATRNRKLFRGAMNEGSVNLAEAMPYVQALTWYDLHHGEERLRQCGLLKVHVITDSRTVADLGIRAMVESAPPRTLRPLWAVLRDLRSVGYVIKFHWARRITSGLNAMSDLIAWLSRRAMLGLDDMSPGGATLATRAANAIDNVRFTDPSTNQPNVYDINPDDLYGEEQAPAAG